MDQSFANIPNRRIRSLAIAGLIMSIVGCVLPFPVYILLSYLETIFPIDEVDTPATGVLNQNLLLILIPLVLSLAGPIAIIVGRLALQKNDPDYILGAWKSKARAGYVLGILATLFVFVPLMLLTLFIYGCQHGC